MTVQPAARSFGDPAAMPPGVRRVLDAMRTAPGRDLPLAEIAAIAGSPPRTLQRQFRTFLGKSPVDALRDIRFEAARRELIRGARKAKVTDIAFRCGFTHFGRFSTEYRRRYGENPSQTLERHGVLTRRPSRAPAVSWNRDGVTIAVVPVEARGEDKAIGLDIAETFAQALMRAGLTVMRDARSARYQLTSVLRRDGRQARLAYRLTETESGRCIWAHHSEGATDDALRFDEPIATSVAAAIQPGLRVAEIARARAKPDTELTAYDLTMRALPHAMALDGDAGERALDLLDRALSIDPDYPLALALAALCYAQRLPSSCTSPSRDTTTPSRLSRADLFTKGPDDGRNRTIGLTQRAATDAADATVLAIVGNALTAANELQMAELVTCKALALDGGSAWAWGRSGWIEVYSGRPEGAIERLTLAVELAPHDPHVSNSMVGLGCAHFQARRYANAIHWLERAVVEHSSAAWAHRILCSAYLLSGRRPEAERSLASLARNYPGVTLSQVRRECPFPQTFRDDLASALESLGVAP